MIRMATKFPYTALLILAATLGVGPASAQDISGCSIHITFVGMQTGECRLIGIYGDQSYLAVPPLTPVAETVVIQQPQSLPAGLYILLLPDQQQLQMLLDVDQQFTMTTRIDDVIGSMTITGSLDNELLYENLRFEAAHKTAVTKLTEAISRTQKDGGDAASLERERDELIHRRETHVQAFAERYPTSFFTSFKMAGQNPPLEYPRLPNGEVDMERQTELYRAKFWNNVNLHDARLLRTPVIHNKLKRYMFELTPQRVDAVIDSADWIVSRTLGQDEMFQFVVNYICLQFRKSTVMGWEGILVHIVDCYFADGLATWLAPEELAKIRAEIDRYRPSLLGCTGQDIRALNPDNQYESLYDLTAPVLVLYIYNMECEHCQEQTPVLKSVYDQWNGRGVDVFALCTNQDVEAWRRYIEKEGLTWHNVIDPRYESRYYSKYNVDITPEMYVLDQNRRIVGMNLKAEQLPIIFEKELAKAGSVGQRHQ